MKIASIYPHPFSIGFYHDINACIITDDQVYAYEESKLSENKNDSLSQFPEKSLLLGLKQLNLTPKDIDIWVFGKPFKVNHKDAIDYYLQDCLKAIGKESKTIRIMPHLLAHASLAVYTSGWNDCMFLVLDGGGDPADLNSMLWGTFENHKFKVYGSQAGNNGFAVFHDVITELIGYNFFDNGKTMGISSYGKVIPELYRVFQKFIKVDIEKLQWKVDVGQHIPESRIDRLDIDSFDRLDVLNTPGKHLGELRKLTKMYSNKDIAATGQKFFEDEIIKFIKEMLKRTGKHKLVCGGGVFQNILLNMRIRELNELQQFYVPLACNDAGLALGAALYWYYKENKRLPKPLQQKYLEPALGPEFSNTEIAKMLASYHLKYEHKENIAKAVAHQIQKGKVVGWFQGRAELGPRALGYRSVLADPRSFNIKARINQLMKKRDWFMPYAPSIMEEYVSEYFDNFCISPYMTYAFKSKPEKAKLIPSAIHIDGTSRPNTVCKKLNPLYYQVIEEFYLLTGIPLILNTSFNRHGIPTIGKPRQAIEHLLNGNIDILAIGDFLVEKVFVEKTPEFIIKEETYLLYLVYEPIIEAFLQLNDANRFGLPNLG